jgi:hypothetical protein
LKRIQIALAREFCLGWYNETYESKSPAPPGLLLVSSAKPGPKSPFDLGMYRRIKYIQQAAWNLIFIGKTI